ncbi:unnamed protein product [Aphanomyces euteiches]
MGKAPPGRQSKQPRGAPPADLDFPIEEIERLQAMPAPVEQNSWKPWAIGAVLVFVAHLTIALVMLQDADPGYFYNVRYANIGNIDFAKDAPYMGYPAIDVVYTWVNGSDPRWKREKDYWHRRWKAQINGEIFDETDESIVFDASAAATENRFRDNEELRYSLRSIEMYAPWVRHVYLVTDGQIPSWLNVDSPRLTIVPHRDIFANRSHLPVFSSPAIESNLDNIPGLSSLFLYFNDDVFLGAPVTPEDFISPSGIQNIYLSWEVPECSSGCQETFLGNGVCDPLCNTTACAFDMGDCGCREVPTADPLEYDVVCDPQPAPAEPVAEPPKAAEPEANPLNCVEACPWLWIGDGSCDVNCNVSACGYDAGDCTTNALTLLPSVVVDATNDTSIGIQVPLNVDALVVRIPDRFDFFDHATFVNEELIRRAVLLEENMTLVLVFARPETTGVPTGGSSMKIEGEVNETTTQFTLHVLRGERAITQGVYTLPGSNLQDLQLLRLVDPASPELVMLSLQVPYHAVDDWAKSVVATNSWTPSQPSLCPPIAPEPSTTTPEGEGQKYYFCILDGRNLNMRWKWNSTALIGTENESPFSQGDICVFNAEQKQCINVILFVDSSNIKWLSPALPTIEKTPTWTGVWDDKEDCVWLDWYLNSFGVLAGNCSFESSKEEEAQPLAPAQPDPEVVKKAKAMCSSIAKRLKLRSEEDAPSVWTQIRDAVLSVKTLFYLNTLTTLEEPRHHMLSTDDVAACEAYFTENAIELPSPPKDDHAVRSTDTFGDSLRFVNKLYNAKFGKVDGFYRRRVPSHMPHFIQKKYLTEMKSHWAAEFNATSSHRFRHPKDMQFSFSYMYYVVNRHKMHPPTLEEVFDTYIDINRDGMIDEHEALSVASLLAKGEHPSEADIEAVKACITPNTTASSREEVRREGKVTITETTQPYLTLESLRECKNVTDKLIQTAIDRLPPTHAMMSEKQVTFHMLSDQYRTAWNQLLNTRAKRTKFICINDDMKYPSVTVGNILNDFFTSLWPHRSQFELPYHLQNRYGHVDELAAAKRMQWIIFGIVLVIVAIIVVAVWWPESSPTNDEKKPSQTATSSSSVEAEQGDNE